MIALATLAVVALLAIGVTLAVHLAMPGASHHPSMHVTTSPNGAFTLHPERDGLTCPVDVAWSPNSGMLALIGYSVCPNAPTLANAHSHARGIVILYDAATGKRIATLHPDQQLTSVARTLGISLATGSTPYLRYQTIMWSPDGKHLALPFFVEYSPAPRLPPFLPSTQTSLPTAPSIAGVLLYDATQLGARPHILTAPYRESALPLEWNLSDGKPISTALSLTPSLSYRWEANGTLLAEEPLSASVPGSASTAPVSPIGNSIGGASFTLWQPGELTPAYLAQNSGVYTSVPGACFWSTEIAAWSPDGAYLVTPGVVSAQLSDPSLATPDSTMLATALATTRLGDAPALAPRDTALLALCQRMTPDSSGYAASAQAIAWRPDGALLAATPDPYLNNVATAGAAQNGTITLYDSATGKAVRTLTIPTNAQAPLTNLLSEQSLWLRWSPNGARLVLLDLYTGTLTLWNVAGVD